MTPVRTRFAPSPTGFLHLGALRTMLFAWLLARHTGGTFCFRIEDTDRTRIVPESIASMVDDFAWLGLDVDEGPTAAELHEAGYGWDGRDGFPAGAVPYIQSLRLARYREIADELVASGHAYRCDCSPARLEAEREAQAARGEPTGYSGFCRDRGVPGDVPHVVRFRIPDGATVSFDDAIRGTIRWDPVILRDTVILKTDGYPTYHLAATVDDHDMAITHVLRGEEWIATTPLHCLLYEALGWPRPVIAHLPVIVGSDGKKLSKRHGATHCRTFREQGYLAPALLNYLLLNGWSPGGGDEQEIMTRDEMVARFTLEQVHSAPAMFSYDKLAWMNGLYMRATPNAELTALIVPFVERAGLPADPEVVLRMVPYIRERLTATLEDAVPLLEFLFVDRVTFGPEQAKPLRLSPEQVVTILSTARDTLGAAPSFEPADVEAALRPLPDDLALSKKAIFMCIRVAITGRTATPPLFECVSVLGRERTIERLEQGLVAMRAS